MVGTIPYKTKGKAKARSKDTHFARTKEGKELVSLTVRSYFTHNPSNVANMQVVRSNSNKRSRTSFSYQRNIPLYSKG
jgi:hypothetical protein